MNDKQSIIKLLMPGAVLRAKTKEAKASVPQHLLAQDIVSIDHFPFKVGRESRTKEIDGKLVKIERRKLTDHEPANSLYLIDPCKPMHISRHHFQIEKNSSGYLLIDRGSACGLSLEKSAAGENVRIGGNDGGGEASLEDGDLITVGDKNSPYVFEFIVLEDQKV